MAIALSHSRLSTYQQCPRKFKLQFLDKAFPDEGKSVHLVRGDNVHKALEAYVIQRLSGMPGMNTGLPEVENTKPLIEKLFATYDSVHPESQVSVNEKFEKVDWFSKDSYYRAIIDFLGLRKEEAIAVDWKTGKVRDYDDNGGGQLHMTSTIVLSIFPEIKKVTTVYVFVDPKKTSKIDVDRSELPKLLDHFHGEHRKVNADTEFNPKTNEFCKFCPATKSQCPYSRKL